MKKSIVVILSIIVLVGLLVGCSSEKKPKVGILFIVGAAKRWDKEVPFIQERAKELGMDVETKVIKSKDQKPPKEECFALIDKGIDVLIFRAINGELSKEITSYAKQKNVQTISYGSLAGGERVDLFVGYDSERMGQRMGQYVTEMVPRGDYIILSGDKKDKYVSSYIYKGGMKYIEPLKQNINIILDESVPDWSPSKAKIMVRDAIVKNGNKIDAVFAANDVLAGACREVLDELNITHPVVITGMDADLSAVQRIVTGKQSCTMYMDLKNLAYTAAEEAYNMAKKQKVNINITFDNDTNTPISGNLITGQLVVKENLDRVLIKNGIYTEQEVYGTK